ncbi:MAG: hypothetical protein QOJ65_1081 [Fimbriimonadaceae bacterium]|nr:hypothetical protein [Fimbriimonadaceae bacterium]
MLQALRQRKAAARLTPEERELLSRPWIHKFGAIDLWVSEQSEPMRIEQIEKQGPIFTRIRDAVRRSKPDPRGIMPTCDDGFFALYALAVGASHVDVVDVGSHIPGHEPWHLDQTRIAAKVGGKESGCTFRGAALLDLQGSYDFGICLNVLENVRDPQAALAHLRAIIDGPIVIHSATAYPNERGVFESPSEFRPWGSRFSHDTLIDFAVESGWTVINEGAKKMPEDWPGDRNLSFLHCV